MSASKVFYRKKSSKFMEFMIFGRKSIRNMRYKKDSAKQRQKEKGKKLEQWLPRVDSQLSVMATFSEWSSR